VIPISGFASFEWWVLNSHMPIKQPQSPEPDDILLSRKDISKLAHVHPKTVARAEARGELTPIRFNSRLVRYRKSNVIRWIANAQA